jgi:hypothetical protein
MLPCHERGAMSMSDLSSGRKSGAADETTDSYVLYKVLKPAQSLR